MPNNLYNQLNNNSNNQYPLFNNLQNVINEFNNFKNSFQGDPQQVVQQLLQTGKMSQQDFNKLYSMAFEFKKIIQK